MTGPESEKPHAPLESQLPDIGELLKRVERRIERERPAAYGAAGATRDGAAADPAAAYVHAAAVLCAFDPARLKPLGEAPELPPAGDPNHASHPMYQLVGHSTLVVNGRGEVRSCLRDNVRHTALQELLEAGKVGEALEANRELAFDESDTAQTVFRAALTGTLRPLNAMALGELTALQLVAPWLEGLALPSPLPHAHQLRYHLGRERLLDPFRQMIGRWEKGSFVEHFRGRKRELRDLRKYVDVAASEDAFETISRGVSAVAFNLLNLHESPPLVIHGPGGVGKSTLLAKFLLQHAEAHDRERFPFVYIDFDRADMLPVNAHTLLSEMALQLIVQYPEAEPALLGFRKGLEEGGLSPSIDPSVPVSVFRNICAVHVNPDRPLLLVLDTLEEVQQSSRDDVHSLFVFLERLQGAMPRLRAVIAGRAPVSEGEASLTPRNYPLLDLDEEAARGVLVCRGIEDEGVADEIIALAGRQPLALKLAADLALDQGLEGIREAAGGSGVLARFRRAWQQTDITARLYQRLLNHIADPEVRKLAHPGLVLRHVTREIIRDVLAEPCGLGEIDDATAADLFERLRRQVSLVSPDGPDVLRQRADVRQMMLPLILSADVEGVVARIQERAVRFYQNREGTAARAEEVYHRLMLGESPRSVEGRWVDGLRAHLRGSLDELPPRAQAFVAARIGEERPDDVWLAADVEDWELHAERRVRKLLGEEEPELAEQVLRQRPDRSAVSRLYGLELLVLDASGRRDEARSAAAKVISLFRQAGAHDDLVREFGGLLTPRDAEARPVFDPGELTQIFDTLRGAKLGYASNSRLKLFLKIPPGYVASIPTAKGPLSQLNLDLRHLNAREGPPGGEHPMVLWLEQVGNVLKGRPEAKAIRSALTKARRRVGKSAAP